MKRIISLLLLMSTSPPLMNAQVDIILEPPAGRIPQYELAEFTVRVKEPAFKNPFTEVELTGLFITGKDSIHITGFADSQDGSIFRLRFSPALANKKYRFQINFKGGDLNKIFDGTLTSTSSAGEGPVITDPLYPRHFIYSGSGKSFYHLGYTAYHLLDPSNEDSVVDSTIRYCQQNGFNKIRFLLTGYPRDFDNRSSDDVDHGVPVDPWKSLNYGAFPGRLNPLPAWQGVPHKYDFERFNVSHWQRIDRAIQLMKENGIIATCIIIIEKQNLPRELGRLTSNEYRLYKYALARLSAYSNVWFDLGNEHNEYRDTVWGNTMGKYMKENDPYNRLTSAHAYADFFYSNSGWADFIITQQYGDVKKVYDWTLKHSIVPKPYINEEYGYEGMTDSPVGHGMNSDWVRRCHWAVAFAGGYATYGDWSKGVSYFYMGFPGPGKAAVQLKHLRSFFELFPFRQMKPDTTIITEGFCLKRSPDICLIYLPEGRKSIIDLSHFSGKNLYMQWYDPRTGKWSDKQNLINGKNPLTPPSLNDWALSIRSRSIK